MRDYNKPKFNKSKCRKCKYHGTGVGYPIKQGDNVVFIHCNYTHRDRGSCLRKLEDGTIVDIRGEDYNNCALFERGKMK